MSQHDRNETYAEPQNDCLPETSAERAAPRPKEPAGDYPAHSPRVLAQVPDLDAEESPIAASNPSPSRRHRVDRGHRTGSQPVEGRLISQKLSARILFAAAGVLLVVAIAAPLFLGGEEAAESSGEVDSWETPAPAPSAPDAPKWDVASETASPWPQKQPANPAPADTEPNYAAERWQAPSAGHPYPSTGNAPAWKDPETEPLATAGPNTAYGGSAQTNASRWEPPDYSARSSEGQQAGSLAAGATQPMGDRQGNTAPGSRYAPAYGGSAGEAAPSDYVTNAPSAYANTEVYPGSRRQTSASYDTRYGQANSSQAPGVSRSDGYRATGAPQTANYQNPTGAGTAHTAAPNRAMTLNRPQGSAEGLRQASVPAEYRQGQYRGGYSQAASRYRDEAAESRYSASPASNSPNRPVGYYRQASPGDSYPQPGSYQQPAGSQRSNAYQPSSSYQQPTPYQQPTSYRQPAAYDPSGQYVPPEQATPSATSYPQTSSASVNEPGVAQFEGVIEKPTVRTTYDRARSSFH